MKRHFYLSDDDRELLRLALQVWQGRIVYEGPSTPGVKAACAFTSPRIRELLERLQEPREPAP